MAFADDCVLGISSCQDASIAHCLISEYESVSQAKLNADKFYAIAKGPGPPVLFQVIKYSTAPIRLHKYMLTTEIVQSLWKT